MVAPVVAPSTGWSSVHPRGSPVVLELPLPVSLPLVRGKHQKRLSPRVSPSPVPAPALPPDYGSLTTAGHPSSSSSRLSKPSMQRNQNSAPGTALVPSPSGEPAPSDSNSSAVPSGLAQPPFAPHSGESYSFLIGFMLILLVLKSCCIVCQISLEYGGFHDAIFNMLTARYHLYINFRTNAIFISMMNSITHC